MKPSPDEVTNSLKMAVLGPQCSPPRIFSEVLGGNSLPEGGVPETTSIRPQSASTFGEAITQLTKATPVPESGF